MNKSFYKLGQQHVLVRFGVKLASHAADISSLELAARDLLQLGAQTGLGKGPLPVPIGVGAGLASALETDGSPVAHGLATGLSTHYGSRLGDYVGNSAGRLLGAGLRMIPLPVSLRGVQQWAGDKLPEFGRMLGEFAGARTGANVGDGVVSAVEDRIGTR